jgi:hypothetical protein
MPARRRKTVVKKTTFEDEQRSKDEAFLKLTPKERLKIHEALRKKIWGKQYNKLSLAGQKVLKKSIGE